MSETLTPDKLIAGDYPLVTDIVTIAAGADLERGACLGKVTASGNYALCDSTAEDGSQSPVAILAEDAAAASESVKAVVYLSGAFNEDAVAFGGTDTADTHRAALRDLNIYLKKVA
jgi:hypothetical protein